MVKESAKADSTVADTTADREIVMTRLIDAPRELVFRAFTDLKQVGKWWGPRGFTTTTHEMSVKPGGTWRFIMHGPDGTDWANEILYREVVKPEEAGKTRLTMRSLFETAAARDFVIREVKAIEGGNQTLDRLEAHLAGMSR